MTDSTLLIREPWTMSYLDTVSILTDALHKQITPSHPLYRREVYPVALRREPDAVIYETEDEPQIYALVYLSWSSSVINGKKSNDPKSEILSDRKAIQARMDMDNAELRAKFKSTPGAES